MSFKGFNPELEKLVKRLETEGELAASEEREKMNSVDDEEMANRYESLVGTIAKKFTKKRQRSSAKDDEQEERDSVKRKKSKKEFMKPSDD
ncbi:M-phase phosphoprotein 6-like [Lingula anatina]|uniref:M-phase phosphoprotein 6-like n=1 Tax=Lingula anatina TaxID=7574 RepID=A0A1S3IVB0_LINAN|nr:M-phase phosphoprotein 6-like [Lingula anatina]|eukprot:XP_013402003.1 M-phase phosphoprotein 6-like [Lingula anatina]